MSDLAPEQQAAYLRARELIRPEAIQQTLAGLKRAADGEGPVDLRRLCEDVAITIRSLQYRLQLERALARPADRIEEFAGLIEDCQRLGIDADTLRRLLDDE